VAPLAATKDELGEQVRHKQRHDEEGDYDSLTAFHVARVQCRVGVGGDRCLPQTTSRLPGFEAAVVGAVAVTRDQTLGLGRRVSDRVDRTALDVASSPARARARASSTALSGAATAWSP
jgi:hypothetical protein